MASNTQTRPFNRNRHLPNEILGTILRGLGDPFGQDMENFSKSCRTFQDLALRAQLEHHTLVLDVKESKPKREAFVRRILDAPEGLRRLVRRLSIEGYVEALEPVCAGGWDGADEDHEDLRRAKTYATLFPALVAGLPDLEELRITEVLFHPYLAPRLSAQLRTSCPKLERLIMDAVGGCMTELRLPGLKSLTWTNSLACPPISLLRSSTETIEELNLDYRSPNKSTSYDTLLFSDLHFPRLRNLTFLPSLIFLEIEDTQFKDLYRVRMGRGWVSDDDDFLVDDQFLVTDEESGHEAASLAVEMQLCEAERDHFLDDVTVEMASFLARHPTIATLSYGDDTTYQFAGLSLSALQNAPNVFLPNLERLEIGYWNLQELYVAHPAVFRKLISLKIWLYGRDMDQWGMLVDVARRLQRELHSAKEITVARAEEVLWHDEPYKLEDGSIFKLIEALMVLKQGYGRNVPRVRYVDGILFDRSRGFQSHDEALRGLKTFL